MIRAGAELFADLPVEIRNEARVHLWYADRFGIPAPPFRDCADAIDSFAAVCCCYGVTADASGRLRVYAPHGYDDLFAMTVRPNRRLAPRHVYAAKAARWLGEWPELTVLPWDGDRPPQPEILCAPARVAAAVFSGRSDRMRATRIIADLRVADLEAAKSFYTDYLGLSTEEFNLGWVARYTSPDTGANVQLVTRDAAAREDPVISVLTEDVDAAYAEAQEAGHEIVHPLTTEPWGVRRFFVRAPDGTVINIVGHPD